MCGIIGYIGNRQAGEIVYQGLRKLEYRGYDSAGIASIANGFLHIKKDVGKIDEIEKKISISNVPGTIAIGHSRWATHGGVTKANAHPHTCCKGEIIVAHNGIVENFQELREELKGHVFSSQTDTEVIPHLIEEENLPLEEAVPRALKKVKGSYALLVISTKEPDKIIAARNESPLIIGVGKNEFFAASDTMPFLGQASKAVYLDDGEIAVLKKDKAEYYSLKTMEKIHKKPAAITLSEEMASKGQNEHFMIKEILEQPTTIRNALAQDGKKLEAFAKELLQAKNLKIVACGTSRHAGLIGRFLFNKLANKTSDVYIASEFSYFADSSGKDTVILAISQSGETADVLDGLRKAKAKGAKILSIVNVVGSTIDRMSDYSLYLNCGPEIGVASTKAFANQLAIFYLLAYAMAGKTNEGTNQIRQAAALVEESIAKNKEKMHSLAESLKGLEHAYFLARGVNFPIATEGALKLKEISYIHAEGMPAGELKHGTLALIEKGTPVILVNPNDYTHSDSLSNGLETKARGAFLIGVSNKNNSLYDYFIEIPSVENELFYPLLAIIPLQLLAYYTAVAKGLDPDKPRNLAKSVTVK